MVKKRVKTICAIVAIPLLCIIVWGGFRIVAMTPTISYATTYNDTLASLPLKLYNGEYKIIFKLDSGFQVGITIDTGNNTDCFKLTSSHWDLFERLGYLNKGARWLAPYPTNTAIKRYSTGMDFFKTYKVGRIPIISTNDGLVKNEINGIHFVEDSKIDDSVIGMLFLSNQIVEFSKKDSVIRFLKFVPSNYVRSVQLKTDTQKLFHYFHRYAMPVEVNGRQNWYFIDTGDLCEAIRLPMSDSQYSTHNMVDSTRLVRSGSGHEKVRYRIDNEGRAIFDGSVSADSWPRHVSLLSHIAGSNGLQRYCPSLDHLSIQEECLFFLHPPVSAVLPE